MLALDWTVAGGQASPRLQPLVEELRLDAGTHDFPSISGFTVARSGMLVVPIQADQQLRLFDASGARKGVIGRRGSGPAEFQRITTFGWLQDTLWVNDLTLSRLSFFTQDGRLLRSAPLPRGPAVTSAPKGYSKVVDFVPWIVTPESDLVGPATLEAATGLPPAKVFMSVTMTGERPRVMFVPRPDTASTVRIQNPDNTGATAGVPFAVRPTEAFSPDGRRVGTLTLEGRGSGTIYTVTIMSLVGRRDTVFAVRHPARAVAIPARVRDSALQAIATRTRNGRPYYPPGIGERLAAMAEERMPSTYPPVESLVLGDDDVTWVVLSRQPTGSEAVRLDATGKAVARTIIPPGSRLVHATAANLWLAETDADGLTSIVRYRLR